MSKQRYSLKENIMDGLSVGAYIALIVLFPAFISCIFYYPSFFWITIGTFIVGGITCIIVDDSIDGMYEDWGFRGMYGILFPEICLYFCTFFLLHILKWKQVLNMEIEWGVLSILGVSSVLMVSIFGGVTMRFNTIKLERAMKEMNEKWEEKNLSSV